MIINDKLYCNISINQNNYINKQEIINGFIGAIIQIEFLFEIFIDNKLYFAEPQFPLLELLTQLLKWKQETNRNEIDFSYNSVETEDGPLLLFIRMNNKFGIDSCWKKFNSINTYTIEELNNFIEIIYNKANNELVEKYNLTLEELNILI